MNGHKQRPDGSVRIHWGNEQRTVPRHRGEAGMPKVRNHGDYAFFVDRQRRARRKHAARHLYAHGGGHLVAHRGHLGAEV